MYLFHGLQASGGVLRSRIDYTVSGFRSVLLFYIVQLYAYAAGTSTSVEVFVAYASPGVLAGEIDRYKCFSCIIF